MQQTKSSGFRFNGRVLLMVAGVGLAFMPTGLLSAVTSTSWELDVLRLLLIVSVSVIAVWPWVVDQRGSVARRLYLWAGPGAASGAYYLLSGNSAFLFASFCFLTGASLDMWMTRAHMASDELRRRLQTPKRSGPNRFHD